jgi:thymidylate synthase
MADNMQFDLIAAADSRWGLSRHGVLPWAGTAAGREDLEWFKQMTPPGTVVIMGRVTWDSLPARHRPLAGRTNVVISNSPQEQIAPMEHAIVVKSLEDGLRLATPGQRMVIGGATIYRRALESPYLRHGYITRIHGDFECDVEFPFLLLEDGIETRVDTGPNTTHNEYFKYDFTNAAEESFRSLCRALLTAPTRRNRTNIPTRGVFHEILKFRLHSQRGRVLPLVTSKNTPWRSIYHELIWFLRGSTDVTYLAENNVHIWDGNSTKEFLDSNGLNHLTAGQVGPCFPPGTMVLAVDGYRRIETVNVGDRLYSMSGTWQSVVARHATPYKSDLVLLQIGHHPRALGATLEHPFLATSTRAPRSIRYGCAEWVPARSLTSEHLVGMKIEAEEITPSFYVDGPDTSCLSPMVVDTEDEWHILGYYANSGQLVDNNGKMALLVTLYTGPVGQPDDSSAVAPAGRTTVSITHEKFDKLLGLSVCEITKKYCKYTAHPGKYLTILRTFGQLWARSVPDWVHKGPRRLVRAFLDGYFAAGSTAPTYDVAASIQRLLAKLGAVSSISAHDTARVTSAGGSPTLAEEYRIEIRPQTEESFIVNGYIWYAVKGVSRRKYDGTVYNFTVTGDNTYIAENVVVHNCYGHQWRRWGGDWLAAAGGGQPAGGVDQIAGVIQKLKDNPWDRRLVVSAWNVSDLPLMALAPCHYSFQLHVDPDSRGEPRFLNCIVNMRSADVALGVPFNIASYAMLTHIISYLVGLVPGTLSISMADCHLYENHLEGVAEMLRRSPRRFPTVTFGPRITAKKTLNIDDFAYNFTIDDYIVSGYRPHPYIKLVMAV